MRRFASASRLSTKPMMGYGATSPRHSSRARALKMGAAGLLGLVLLYFAHNLLLRSDMKYGLMIDAGSTGSRMHTFTFRETADGRLKLAAEDFFPVKPGLSAYVNEPIAAAHSLEPLLKRAREIVPASKREDTPVFLRATAGLRAVGVHKAELILDEVRTYLSKSGFRFDGRQSARVLDGSDEGVYTWITVNYLMGRSPFNTVGTLEMGGGSSQAAFVSKETGKCAPETLQKEYAGRPVSLYAKSDLGFGLQKGRASALKFFESQNTLRSNPCFNRGAPLSVKVPFEERSVAADGSGDFVQCRRAIEQAVITPRANGTCTCSVCGYDGALRPKPIGEYVAIAFYVERTAEIGLPTPIRVQDIRRKGEEICAMSVQEVQQKYPKVPNGEATDLCLDLAFIVEHLEHGHGITEQAGTLLHVKKTIGEFELGWSLGAMFYEMSRMRT